MRRTGPADASIFSREVGSVQAVSDVSFDLVRGETLGLVGESGCEKSTLGRCLLRLIEPTSGQVIFDGQDLVTASSKQIQKLRRRMQIIFQAPYASLNPRMTVGEMLEEPMQIHGLYTGGAVRQQRIQKSLDLCGMRREAVSKYPHEFSGGQRQRVCIARALAVEMRSAIRAIKCAPKIGRFSGKILRLF